MGATDGYARWAKVVGFIDTTRRLSKLASSTKYGHDRKVGDPMTMPLDAAYRIQWSVLDILQSNLALIGPNKPSAPEASGLS
jgi:hypothetical protein